MKNFKYPNLRNEMYLQGFVDEDICPVIKRSKSYVSGVLSGRRGKFFGIKEGYQILDWLKIKHECFNDYFGPSQVA